MAILAVRSRNIRFTYAPVIISSVMILAILVFGVVPIVGFCVLLGLTVFCSGHWLPLMLLWCAILPYEVIFPDVPIVQIGTILLLPVDIPYFLGIVYLIRAAVVRPQEIVTAIKENPFLSLFLLIIVISVIIYTPFYGKMAIGEARKSFFYFFFPLLAIISIKTLRDLHQLTLAIFIIAVSFMIFGYLNLLMGKPIVESYLIVKSELRVIPSQAALLLVLTIFSILIAHLNGAVIVNKTIDIVMVGLFLPLIIMTHHRTVFLTAALGLLLLFGLQRDKMLFSLKVIAAAIILFIIMELFFMNIPAFEHLLMNALAGITDPGSDNTASWRMEGWHQQLINLSAIEILLGKGLGSYYQWYNELYDEVITITTHNAYVQIVLKFGLLGLVVYGLLVLSFFRKTLAVRNMLPPGPMRAYIEISLLSFGASHAYITGYDFSPIMLIFYAIGITVIKVSQSDGRVIGYPQKAFYKQYFHSA